MTSKIYIFAFSLAALVTVEKVAAQAPDTVSSLPGIEIQTEVDRAESYVGDLITYTLTITYDSTYALLPPPLGANLGAFEVKDYQPDIESELDDGRIQSKTIFVLSTYTTGDYIIPSLPVIFTLPDSTRKVMMAEPIPMTILSLLDMAGGDTLDIKPLKGPYDFPPDYSRYYLWGGGGLLVLMLGGLLLGWYLWRRSRRRGELEDLREPWEIAFEKLAYAKVEYLDKGLGEQPRAKAYYIELTEIVRTYLGRIYETDVLEMTTEQFLQEFSERELPGGIYDRFGDFFGLADRVKFARLMPERTRAEEDFLTAHDIIEKVRIDRESRRQAETHINGSVDNPNPVTEENPA
jgi:hypothetical protein